ncbi:hypothetical protein HYQ45_017389 [Verticillium longisporum]
MQTASTTARGIKPGGLSSSKWASTTSPAWSSRGTPTYTPRSSSSSSSAVGPRETSAITPATQWWETPNPEPKLRDPAAETSAAAPSPATSAAAPTTAPPPPLSAAQRELRRYVQIVRRMKWKLPYLQDGYRRALTREDDAELMFKLDFYEYYMLLERALVHLLGVFGRAVERGPAPAPASANGTGTAANGTHRYHQNVLAALERADNPLRAALGTGDVRVFLGRAKELRNRWKYAEGDESSTAQQQQQSSLKGPTRGITGRAPLESYDLDSMFGHIFGGFDQGYGIAEAWVAELASRADMVPAVAADGTPGADMAVDDDEEFDFMVDAMDWEAV